MEAPFDLFQMPTCICYPIYRQLAFDAGMPDRRLSAAVHQSFDTSDGCRLTQQAYRLTFSRPPRLVEGRHRRKSIYRPSDRHGERSRQSAANSKLRNL